MENLRRSLPPAHSLVVFEAAARHLNFTRAAAELNVSQVAVSKQIQTLEKDLGVQLFGRQGRKLSVTPEGQKFYEAVAVSLRHVAQVSDEMRQLGRRSHLVVSTTIAFASYWLMPRLAGFRQRHPEVDIGLLASDPYFGEVTVSPDISVRFHAEKPPGDDVLLLLGEEIFPVCSPSYLGRRHLQGPAALTGEKLLHLDEVRYPPMTWEVWLSHFDVTPERDLPGPRFPNFNEFMRALETGAGIGLGWRHLCDDAVASGRLIPALPDSLTTNFAYYLHLPPKNARSKAAQMFADWIVEEAGAQSVGSSSRARNDPVALFIAAGTNS